MGDSDDEYDRKRRDKFRGERAEATYRSTERAVRPRDEWQERDVWSRPRPRDYRGAVRDRGYSPSMEPTAKRMRHDYYGENYYNHYQPYHQPQRNWNFPREPAATAAASAATTENQQPVMMSFKAFLAAQDDNISDSEAVEKYNEYKLEFQRQQLNEFFVAHKDDEWFRLKYHPEDSVKRKEEQSNFLKKRVEVFLNLLNSGKIGSVSVDVSKTNDLLKLLDTVVVKLEGGTDEDLAALEEEYAELEKKQELKSNEDVIEVREDKTKPEEKEAEKKEETIEDKKEDNKVEETSANDMKESGELDDDEEEGEHVEKSEEKPAEKMQVEENGETKDEPASSPKEENNSNENKEKKRKRSFSGSSNSSSSSSESDEEKTKEDDAVKDEEKNKDSEKEEVNDTVKEKVETIEDDPKPDKPRALHKTTSIFLRNLAPTITRQEVEAVCSRYDGFLRVALADPQPERRWMRRGWVTFKRDANIKEICWNLNNIRLRDCELGAIVNRDLSRRIRAVNGIVAHRQVVRSDIRIAAKVTLHLDTKTGLWQESQNQEKPQQTFGLVSNNPVLYNITDYLIEEASAEEEELLGLDPSSDAQDAATTMERDESLISVLDKIILYLRIVHSLDYYNHCEYPNEDEMPNRCGILHARGPPPTAKTDITQFIGSAVEAKMAQFLPEKAGTDNKNEAKLLTMALKDVDTEIDKFVQANTRELAKDKWLCPLSGKKFKGPDFVRKHIFNKHGEKIEEVKKEVEFFNNYLKDPKRPMLEMPQPRKEEAPNFNHPQNYGSSYGYGPPAGRFYNQGYGRPRPYMPPRPRGGGAGGDFRPVIHYRDLDAPREPEEFI